LEADSVWKDKELAKCIKDAKRQKRKTDVLLRKNRHLAARLQKELDNKSDEVIRFEHVKGYKFESGSYTINSAFKKGIEDRVIPEVEKLVRRHGKSRIVVEVFGFTDGEYVKNKKHCSMDQELVAYNRDVEDARPQHCSNVDLGKLRADTAAKYIRHRLRWRGWTNISVVGCSVGQTVLANDQLAATSDDGERDPKRRFVDVRFRLKYAK